MAGIVFKCLNHRSVQNLDNTDPPKGSMNTSEQYKMLFKAAVCVKARAEVGKVGCYSL